MKKIQLITTITLLGAALAACSGETGNQPKTKAETIKDTKTIVAQADDYDADKKTLLFSSGKIESESNQDISYNVSFLNDKENQFSVISEILMAGTADCVCTLNFFDSKEVELVDGSFKINPIEENSLFSNYYTCGFFVNKDYTIGATGAYQIIDESGANKEFVSVGEQIIDSCLEIGINEMKNFYTEHSLDITVFFPEVK